MHLSVASDVSLALTKVELLAMAEQLQEGETLVLKFQLEDSNPLYENVPGHITNVDHERFEIRKPITVEAFGTEKE